MSALFCRRGWRNRVNPVGLTVMKTNWSTRVRQRLESGLKKKLWIFWLALWRNRKEKEKEKKKDTYGEDSLRVIIVTPPLRNGSELSGTLLSIVWERYKKNKKCHDVKCKSIKEQFWIVFKISKVLLFLISLPQKKMLWSFYSKKQMALPCDFVLTRCMEVCWSLKSRLPV